MLKNKKGLILTAGITAILAITIFLIIGMLMVFVSVNKFAIIGGGLIALVLIFGLKGEFNKQKAIFMTIIIGLGLFFILGGNMLQTQFGPGPSHIFIDRELGMITTAKQGFLTEQAYFKNLAGSGITVSNVGEKVQVCDYFLMHPGMTYNYVNWIFKKNGVIIATTGITQFAQKTGFYCRDFVPDSPGTYEVVTESERCPSTDGWVCRQLGTQYEQAYKEGNSYRCSTNQNLVIGGIQICKDGKCNVGSGECSYRLSSDTKQYFLEVKSKEDPCNKAPYTGSWYIAEYIDNGKILKQKVWKVSNDCRYVVNFEIVQTQCNDNYLIEGSTLQSTENDGWKCVSAQTDNPEDDLNNDGIDDGYTNRDDECNIDLLIECGDGSQITSKLCVSGLYFDSGAECAVIGDNNDGILDEDDDKDGNGILDVDEDESERNFMQKYGMWIIGGIFVLIILVIVIIKFKKR